MAPPLFPPSVGPPTFARGRSSRRDGMAATPIALDCGSWRGGRAAAPTAIATVRGRRLTARRRARRREHPALVRRIPHVMELQHVMQRHVSNIVDGVLGRCVFRHCSIRSITADNMWNMLSTRLANMNMCVAMFHGCAWRVRRARICIPGRGTVWAEPPLRRACPASLRLHGSV